MLMLQGVGSHPFKPSARSEPVGEQGLLAVDTERVMDECGPQERPAGYPAIRMQPAAWSLKAVVPLWLIFKVSPLPGLAANSPVDNRQEEQRFQKEGCHL